MTLAGEIAGAFLGGAVSTLASIALLGPRFVRWYMKRKLAAIASPEVMGEYVSPPKP